MNFKGLDLGNISVGDIQDIVKFGTNSNKSIDNKDMDKNVAKNVSNNISALHIENIVMFSLGLSFLSFLYYAHMKLQENS